ncbi:MAG: putative manganese transporter [Clostridia bacterium]|jgi:hypothetical protein
MTEVFFDALIDTAKMIPLLLIIYVGIEFVELKFGKSIRNKIKKTGKAGPLIGAAFGCVPQCGFSVISSALYTQRLITLGTLMAVFISTSDEAIPIILARPDKLGVILPIILIKIVLALIAGYAIDLFFKRKMERLSEETPHTHEITEKGCCGHECATEDKVNIKELVVHPLIHTAKVFLFIFITSLLLNYIIFRVGPENLNNFLLGHSIFQPVFAALFGLIPNCAASVVITQMFLSGGLSFGSVIAGLSSSAGLGLLVLFKENKIKDSLRITGILLSVSIAAGIIIQIVYG